MEDGRPRPSLSSCSWTNRREAADWPPPFCIWAISP